MMPDKVGTIIFNAFSTIAQKHGFTSDFPSIDIAKDAASSLLSNPNFYSVIAEEDSNVIGINFLDERSNKVAGIGPLAVDPKSQNKGVGRQLMINTMQRLEVKTLQEYVYFKHLIITDY